MEAEVHEIHGCEVCGNKQLAKVLNLGLHPMCDDLVEIENQRHCRQYPIEILYCTNCYTAHQQYQVPKQDLFPTSYHYRARFTADVLNGMKELVKSCESQYGKIEGKTVLDIGCNDGSLLSFFKEKGAKTIGVEPTGAYSDARENGHDVVNDYLSPKVSEHLVAQYGQPHIITFTNVFAHIEDLHEVVASLKILMSPDTLLVIENHYLGAVLEGNQFDTFYHEHPRTYSYKSFVRIAQSLESSLLNVEFPSRYGGNIRVFIGNHDSKVADTFNQGELEQKESRFLDKFNLMNANISKWKSNKSKEIEELVKTHGKIAAKAFPGRAAILIKLLDLDENSISAVYEKPGSMKIGHYLPGTRIPILSDDDFRDKTKPLLNLAWHISSEIHQYLRGNGHTGPIVDILNADDFT